MKRLVLMIISVLISSTLLSNSDETRMTMTVQAPCKLYIGVQSSNNVTIDWGNSSSVIIDVTVEYVQISVSLITGNDTSIFVHPGAMHAYTDTSVYTVTIIGENITTLECSLYNNDGFFTRLDANTALTSLDVSKNTALTSLNVSSCNLTALDVSKNTALTSLDCSYNQITVAALNVLFGTLNESHDEKTLNIRGNPGTDDCDKTIAESKGWYVLD